MRALKVSYSDEGERGVAVNCEKNTIFPEHPVGTKLNKTNGPDRTQHIMLLLALWLVLLEDSSGNSSLGGKLAGAGVAGKGDSASLVDRTAGC